MRLKTFTAPSMSEAIRLVRESMGADAIIVSDQPAEGGGVIVTAAVDSDATPLAPVDGDTLDRLIDVLAYHAVPPLLGERILTAAALSQMSQADALGSLTEALDEIFAFAPVQPSLGKPVMLVGTPAAGKTVTLAKLAARRQPNRWLIVSTEAEGAGSADRLAAFARSIGANFVRAGDPAALADAVTRHGYSEILIDSGGINPFDRAEIARLVEFVEAAGADPVFVLAAGGDATESAEIAETFARHTGSRRMIVTRADLARRMGGVLAAADAGRLTLAEIGLGAAIAGSLEPMSPDLLARQLLPFAEAPSFSAKLHAVAS